MMERMSFRYDDGGRAAAGFKGAAGDCVCRAIAIATEQPYQSVYDALNALGAQEIKGKRRGKSFARTGVYAPTIRRYMQALGWTWTPTMSIGSGCLVHLRADELPSGRLVVSLSRHVAAVIYDVIRDTHDCSRGGTRCVYGYWTHPQPAHYGPMCRDPSACAGKGYCPRDPNCAD